MNQYTIIPEKLSYFTDLNLAAKKGDDFPKINHDFQGSGEQGSVVIKFTQIIAILLDWFKGKSTGNHGFYHQI